MANQLLQLLAQWYERRDSSQWVLGTVYKTEGPCYRKAGAMMLFDGLGRQFGLLSGGCLESDIQLHARRVMQSGRAVKLCYDSSDEDDLSFQLGIGCGGTVYILLQPVNAENHYLHLDALYRSLRQRRRGYYYQFIPDASGAVEARFEEVSASAPGNIETLGPNLPLQGRPRQPPPPAELVDLDRQQWLLTPTVPPIHLLVAGGGLDARPLVAMAGELGWQITLADPRPANARAGYFSAAATILRHLDATLADYVQTHTVDAAILMTHNVAMDAMALKVLQNSRLGYMALLGPASRRARVLEAAGLTEAGLSIPLAGPAGLDLGATLPESIALSMLAECHAHLHGAGAQPLSVPPLRDGGAQPTM